MPRHVYSPFVGEQGQNESPELWACRYNLPMLLHAYRNGGCQQLVEVLADSIGKRYKPKLSIDPFSPDSLRIWTFPFVPEFNANGIRIPKTGNPNLTAITAELRLRHVYGYEFELLIALGIVEIQHTSSQLPSYMLVKEIEPWSGIING